MVHWLDAIVVEQQASKATAIMSSLPPAAEGIAAVAARIQDRANQLSSERAVLELVQAEQAEQQALLDEAAEECGLVRREYLSAIRARHGVELELWRVESLKTACLESMDKLQQETKEMRQYKEELQSSWGQLVNDALADHQLKREIYRHSAQASIGQREDLMQKRSRQLASLQKRIETFRRNERSIEQEKKKIQKELEQFKKAEQKEDEEVSKLALEVKEVVAKVKKDNSRLEIRVLFCPSHS